jgi:hypothetical protein
MFYVLYPFVTYLSSRIMTVVLRSDDETRKYYFRHNVSAIQTVYRDVWKLCNFPSVTFCRSVPV